MLCSKGGKCNNIPSQETVCTHKTGCNVDSGLWTQLSVTGKCAMGAEWSQRRSVPHSWDAWIHQPSVSRTVECGGRKEEWTGCRRYLVSHASPLARTLWAALCSFWVLEACGGIAATTGHFLYRSYTGRLETLHWDSSGFLAWNRLNHTHCIAGPGYEFSSAIIADCWCCRIEPDST